MILLALLTALGILARRIPVILRAQRTAADLPEAGGAVLLPADCVALIPIWSEPAAAVAAWHFWSEQARLGGACFQILVSAQDSATLSALGEQTGPELLETSVFCAQGSAKAEMLMEALAALRPEVRSVAVFDSDSRPSGVFSAEAASSENEGPEPVLVAFAPSVYQEEKESGAFAAGCALWQTCWSLGFEAGMSARRPLWYLVGHGLVIDRDALRQTGLDPSVLTEDLLLGYQLSAKLSPGNIRVLTAREQSCWPGGLREQRQMVGRWFWGDVAASWTQRHERPLPALVRVLELISTWALAPLVIPVLILLLAYSGHPGGAAALAGLGAGLLAAPAFLLPDHVLPRTGGRRSRLRMLPGLLARPLLDALAILLHPLGQRASSGVRTPTPKRVPEARTHSDAHAGRASGGTVSTGKECSDASGS